MFFSRKKEANQVSQNDDRINVDTSTITTMVGVDTVVEGTLRTKSSVRINGTVIGNVRADGIVILTKSGMIEGTIEAESIIVAGVVRGNMSIRDKVNVEATGEIYGEVITKKFVIDEESIFQGNCIMNRDGKVIPVPPYVKESDKDTDEKKEDKKDDKKEQKEEVKEDKDEQKSDESEKVNDSEKKEEDKSDKKKEKDSVEESEEKDNSDEADTGTEDKEDKDNKDEDNSEDDSADDKDETDDTIIIADINDVEGADDIPASDGNTSGKNKKKNFVKKSKSLSVEIQE